MLKQSQIQPGASGEIVFTQEKINSERRMKKTLLNIRNLSFGLLAVVVMTTTSSQAFFSTNYGNFAGANVNFLGVSESTVSESVPLYHYPVIAGNTIDFNPQGFGAFATGLGGNDNTDGQLSLTLKANPLSAIPTINFWELGDYSLSGSGSFATLVDVTANWYVNIIAVDGVTLGAPVNINGTMPFTPNASGTFFLPTNPGFGNLWGGSINIDLNNALTLAGVLYNSGATEVRFTFDNELNALSEFGTTATIKKKDIQGSVGITVIVPEPTILALSLCGAGLLISRRSKR
jgi:hypothetical protein